MRWLVFFLGLALLGSPDGTDDGRRGNALYEQGDYEAAEDAYRAALDAVDDSTGAVYAALQNNLGAALFRQEKHGDARTAFEAAAEAATTDAETARALYNAGLAAAADGRLEAALDRFRRVLLNDPTHADARHNFEYLKREMRRRQQQRGSPPPEVEPSDYARRLKRQAETMVAEQQYDEALSLLEAGMRRDSTVRAYQDFISRLRDVDQIDGL